ncbi:hypothetical protein FRC04_008854 [Tulasnella sp. 424]|nr:hypothetical protein FRC04_008854 [Tulasnella sp. 424]
MYQGHHGWHKWFEQPIPEGGHPRFDLWPDVSSYDAKEVYPVPGLTLPNSNGEPAKLFSSRNPATTKRHFHLMAEHGIDGVFLMRNANELAADNDSWNPLANLTRISDEVVDGVKVAAEAEGRVWALMYDLTGVPPDKLAQVLRHDWGRLVVHKRLLNSPSYLREQGRPVIGLKGIGLKGAYQDPAVILDIIRQLRTFTPGGAYIVAGVSPSWRTPFEGDNDGNPGFEAVYRDVDAINPWSIGRIKDIESSDWYAVDMREDVKLIRKWNEETSGRKRVDYIPVVFPGVSRGNLSSDAYYNEIPRKSGTFLWRQVYHCQREGAHSMIISSFDDLNSGTATMPITTLGRLLPNERRFLALDGDGDTSLPSDWYLRICGMAGEALRGEKRIATDLMPKKELDDYWAMRPKYEEDQQATASAGGSSSAADAMAYGGASTMAGSAPESSSSAAGASGSLGPSQPMRAGTVDFDNLLPPPPAYTLVDEGPPVTEEPEAVRAPSQAPAPAAPASQAPAAPVAATPARAPASPAPVAPSPSAPVVVPAPATPAEPAVVVVPAPSSNRPPTPIGSGPQRPFVAEPSELAYAQPQQRPGGSTTPRPGGPPASNVSTYGPPATHGPSAALAAGMGNLSLQGSSSARPTGPGTRPPQSVSPPSQSTPLPNSSYGPGPRPWSPGQQSSSSSYGNQQGPQQGPGSYPQPQVGATSNAAYGSQSNSTYGPQSNSSYGAPAGNNNSSYGAMPSTNSNSSYGTTDSSFGMPSAASSSASGYPAQPEPGFTVPGHGPTRMDSSASIGGFASPELARINSGRMPPPPMHPNRPGSNRPAPVASSPFAPPVASSPFATPPVPGAYNTRPPNTPPVPGAARPGSPGSYPLPGENASARPNASYGPSSFTPSSAGPGVPQFPSFGSSPHHSPGPATAPLPSNSSYSSSYNQPSAPSGPGQRPQPSCPSSGAGSSYPGGSQTAAPGPMGASQPSNSSCSSSYNQPAGPLGPGQRPQPSPSPSSSYTGGSHPAAPGPVGANQPSSFNPSYPTGPQVGPGSSSFGAPSSSMFPSTSPGPSNRPPGGYPQPSPAPLPGRQDSASSASSTVIPTPKPFGMPAAIVNPARQALDKYAGEERRKQFEKGVDSAFQMGSKWLGKFGK